MDALQRLPGLEQLGAFRGEICDLTREGVPLDAQHIDALLQLDRVVPEPLQLPREAMVVVALHHLDAEPRAWAGFLRVAADLIPSILDTATRSADAGLVELLG